MCMHRILDFTLLWNQHKIIDGSMEAKSKFYLYLHTRVEEGRLPAAEFSSLVLMVDQSLTSLTLVAGNCAEAGAEAGLPRTGRMGGRCTSWRPACSYVRMLIVCRRKPSLHFVHSFSI